MISGAIGGMKFGRGNRSTRRKPTPAPQSQLSTTRLRVYTITPLDGGGLPVHQEEMSGQ
jgi:hypothetical protein